MNNKIIMIGLLLTALNVNAQIMNNCDSTCYQNTTQSQTPINTNTTSTGGALLSNNFNSIQNPVGAQDQSDNSPSGSLCGFGTWMGIALPCKGYRGNSCPPGYYFNKFTYTDGGKISHCVKQ